MHISMVGDLLVLAADTVNPGDSSSNFAVSITTVLYLMISLFGIAIASPFLATYIQNRALGKQRKSEAEVIEQKLVEHNATVHTQLSEIHDLVNSNLFTVLNNERNAVAQALAAIEVAIDVKKSLHLDVLPETLAARTKLEEQLSVLDNVLGQRPPGNPGNP